MREVTDKKDQRLSLITNIAKRVEKQRGGIAEERDSSMSLTGRNLSFPINRALPLAPKVTRVEFSEGIVSIVTSTIASLMREREDAEDEFVLNAEEKVKAHLEHVFTTAYDGIGYNKAPKRYNYQRRYG